MHVQECVAGVFDNYPVDEDDTEEHDVGRDLATELDNLTSTNVGTD